MSKWAKRGDAGGFVSGLLHGSTPPPAINTASLLRVSGSVLILIMTYARESESSFMYEPSMNLKSREGEGGYLSPLALLLHDAERLNVQDKDLRMTMASIWHASVNIRGVCVLLQVTRCSPKITIPMFWCLLSTVKKKAFQKKIVPPHKACSMAAATASGLQRILRQAKILYDPTNLNP